jgi:glutamine synthetase
MKKEASPVTDSPGDVLNLIRDNEVQIVDLRFADLPGLMQHFSVPAHELTEEGFEEGFGFDGSSIRGFQEIQESDMILVPDPGTAVVDPFRTHPTLIINCFVKDPVTGEPYTRDPRHVAAKAERYLEGSGIAQTSYWGPEAEFYIFDSVRFDQDQHSAYYYVDAVEGAWNSGAEEGGRNLGYKPRYKEGYFPVPPTCARRWPWPWRRPASRSRSSTTRSAPPARPRSTSASAPCWRPPTG